MKKPSSGTITVRMLETFIRYDHSQNIRNLHQVRSQSEC